MSYPFRHIALMLGCLLGLCSLSVAAQTRPAYYDYARPELKWYTIETEHFKIQFHADEEGNGSSRTAQVVARIAEDVYGPITSLYNLEPDTKVAFILKDYEDYSNGAAYFFDNMIEIWAPALQTPLRGDHNWLRNVITHEFTHIIQVQKTMKADRQLPFFYFQLLDYEQIQRPDILYGYPDIIVSYPIPVLNNPAWLAEGTAQYQRAALDYDRWDTHRDMVLRTRILAQEELSLTDMGGFYSHNSLERESVYNHGYAFTRYLANTYGENALSEVSEQLGRWSNWNFKQAAKDAFGVSGNDIYKDWIATLREEYTIQTAAVRANLVEGELLESKGFSNFYPRFSPDGKRVAYLSNKGQDFNIMALYIHDLETNEISKLHIDGLQLHDHQGYTCSLGHRVTRGTSGAFSWRPDGKALVYTRIKDTKKGYLYADLYELDLETKKETRLTTNIRATEPAYAPDGASIAYIANSDGSRNLYVLDLATNAVQQLTDYQDGTQLTEPRWHPNASWIYYGQTKSRGRDIYRIRTDGSDPEPVLATAHDERSPAFDLQGDYLYYASDASGIYNLYRLPVDQFDDKPEQLTNVLGGAFMPDVSATGEITFAQYQWDGYKIAKIDAPKTLAGSNTLARYTPPAATEKNAPPALASAEWTGINRFDDADLNPLGKEMISSVESQGTFSLKEQPLDLDVSALETQEVKKYSNLFTSFSFYPVLRFDQYVSSRQTAAEVRLRERSRGETLLRNTKIGFYTSSREIFNGLSMFGGLTIGPWSREASSFGDFISPNNLLKLERDIFLQFDYNKGLGFIPNRWSPQFSLQLFNVVRNVDNGLVIEEFPCTACFPDTTLADLSYNLWELDFAVRSKVNRYVLLEAGYRYSPYRATTEQFFSKELNQTIPETSTRYFIGQAVRLKAYYEAMLPHRDSDVVPVGIRASAGYEYEPGQLLEEFNVEDGFLKPVYEKTNINRLFLDARLNFKLPGSPLRGSHGVGLRFRGSTVLGKPVDNFYNDYIGGLIGARGYPFYALGGNETLWFQVSYHFPLFAGIGKQVLFTYFDKLYARVFADAAMAFTGEWPGTNAIRKDVGAELRLSMGSFYLFPTAIFLSATYGINSFFVRLDDNFVTPDGSNLVPYGGSWLWHFGVLFEFDQL